MRQICEVLGFNKSTFYYQPKSDPSEDVLRPEILRLAAAYPTYGYRRITKLLVAEGHPVGYKRVSRLMREMNLSVSVKRACRTPRSLQGDKPWRNLLEDLEVSHPDQVWVGDITYVRLKHRFIYVAVLMDVFTRRIRGWNLSQHLTQALTLPPLEQALHDRVLKWDFQRSGECQRNPVCFISDRHRHVICERLFGFCQSPRHAENYIWDLS